MSVAVLVIVAAVGGAVYGAAIAPSAVTSTNVDAYRRSTASKPIDKGAGVWTTIVSVSLPPGKWILNSTATFVSFGAEGGIARCGIFAGSTLLDFNSHSTQSAGYEISVIAAVKKSASFTARLRCLQDVAVTGAANYVDPGAALWAHKSSSLSL